MNGSPPRPRLTVSVGVTGHRLNKLGEADLPMLRRRIKEALSAVRQSVERVAADRSADYAGMPPLLRIISALAEGADRIVVEEALGLGFELQVALPYAANLHAPEFSDPGSYAAFEQLLTRAAAVLALGGKPRAPESYQAVGLAVIQHSDIMLAVWDGQSASGVGGTGEMVMKAAEQRVPIIHINSKAPHTTALRETSSGATLGTSELGQLPERLAKILAPPSEHSHHGLMLADLRRVYFREVAVRGRLGHAFGVVINLTSRWKRIWPRLLPSDYVQATLAEWRGAPPLPQAFAVQLEEKLLTPYAWADNLATYYANRYRSAFTWTYLLAPIAVLAALLDYFAEPRRVGPTAWVWVELGALLCIFGLYQYGMRRLWHERWLDYRSLAERLRHLAFLWPLDGAVPALPVPAHHGESDPRATWVEWYIRAVLRDAGLFDATIDGAHLEACRVLLLDKVIRGQIDYHRGNARMRVVHHRLHLVATALFGGAILACLAHFVAPIIPRIHKEVFTLMAAVLPACGAAVHGFLSQGDFQTVARRSDGMRADLEDLAYRVERAEEWDTLRGLAQATADVMGAELIDWRVGFEGKPPTLPG